MQKRIGIVSIATALLVVGWSQASLAQGNCGDIVFTGDIATRFPNAKNACLDVATRNGEKFAHFKARIRSVRAGQVEAEFMQPNGTYSRPVSFTPAREARVRIQGQTYRYGDLSRGQELDLYLPTDRWQIAVQEDPSTTFAAAPAIQLVALEEPTQQVASLPKTGSPLPLLALVGTLLAALGACVAGVRHKLGRAA
jgi:LPXTG-motif cell wall-anchored protein